MRCNIRTQDLLERKWISLMCPRDKSAVDKYALYTPRLDSPFLALEKFRWTSVKKNFIYIGVGVKGTVQACRFTTCMGTKEFLVSLLIKIVSRDITNPDKICRAKCRVSLLMLDGDLSVAVCLLEKLKKTTCYESLAVRRLELIHEVITESTFIFMKDSRCHVNILTDNIQCRSNSFLTDLSAFYDHEMVFSFSRLFYSICSWTLTWTL